MERDRMPTDDGEAGWSWPPSAPWESGEESWYAVDEWAPSSIVRYPWLRLGRWTLLYRRSA